MNKTNNMSGKNIRTQLLATVSTAVLLASIYGAGEAQAATDSDRPPIWIDLGMQLDRLSSPEEQYSPPFVANIPDKFFSPLAVQKPPAYAFDGDGSISFEPDGSDWVLSASIHIGRSSSKHKQHQQTQNAEVYVTPFAIPLPFPPYVKYHKGNYNFYPYGHVKFEDAKEQRSEIHTVLDFQAGKDVGLGMFGWHGSSVVSAGVRIAQFTSKTHVHMSIQPDVNYPTGTITAKYQLNAFQNHYTKFHDYAADLSAQRSFRGVGPSLSWAGSAPIAGNPERGDIAFDWGLNAALLFGRQKARGHHQTTTRTYTGYKFHSNPNARYGNIYPGYFENRHGGNGPIAQRSDPADFNRVRSVAVPNLGGFAGLSFRYAAAKVSFGYKADFFFNAIDGGIDARKSENRGFFGPYASSSVGLGD